MRNCNHCQQDELYRSELAGVRGRTIAPAELQAFVDDLAQHPYWSHFDIEAVDTFVRTERQARAGSVGAYHDGVGHIEMAPCHLTEQFILHELAHVLTTARYGSNGHGPWFARTYLELVYNHMGPEAYAALKAAFVKDGIEHTHDSSPQHKGVIAL